MRVIRRQGRPAMLASGQASPELLAAEERARARADAMFPRTSPPQLCSVEGAGGTAGPAPSSAALAHRAGVAAAGEAVRIVHLREHLSDAHIEVVRARLVKAELDETERGCKLHAEGCFHAAAAAAGIALVYELLRDHIDDMLELRQQQRAAQPPVGAPPASRAELLAGSPEGWVS